MLYYEIKLRIEEINAEENKIYIGNGVVRINDDIIEGIIARDYVEGWRNENHLEIYTLDIDFRESYSLQTKGDSIQITMPGAYMLYGSETFEGKIYAKGKIEFVRKLSEDKIKEMEKRIEKVKKIALS